MSHFEIAIAEKDHTGQLRFKPREFADDLATAQRRALELAEGRHAVLISGLYGSVRPVDGWYWDYEEKRFNPDGAWVHTKQPFSVEPKPRASSE
jgi:hypothetical protein